MLADQASHDDLFTARALTGEAGQRFQNFLRAAGLTKRYLILRTLPVDTLDLTDAQRNALLDHAEVQALHRELLQPRRGRQPGIAALVALGPGAAAAGAARRAGRADGARTSRCRPRPARARRGRRR